MEPSIHESMVREKPNLVSLLKEELNDLLQNWSYLVGKGKKQLAPDDFTTEEALEVSKKYSNTIGHIAKIDRTCIVIVAVSIWKVCQRCSKVCCQIRGTKTAIICIYIIIWI